jgi:hypothetical protein
LCPLGDDGSFELHGMPEGRYDLVASGANGWFGALRGVSLRPGDSAPPLEITMQPGARVHVGYRGPASQARVRIYDGDAYAAFGNVSAGSSRSFSVPTGRLRVEVRLDEHTHQSRDVTLEVGGEARVDVQFD